ncbi:phosphatase PAP2 family protein [Leptobacterium flavescens]|uniref:Phosphatase PAP2 family protein n=1 Tax=Leptobacterium flavescens TaxID=472055 RepID=A0A6P0UK08_9FLAO|nr:phosphatase PAP2 family protein [Leptobacterium flavescens]NER12218.1 phosphatase PAP2 family protein [Leptobacterium flavescens]
MLEELIRYDKELFLFLNNLGTENWDGFWMFMTNKWASIPLYFVLLLICLKKTGWKATLIIVVAVALMITATDQLANAFKYGVARLRPCHDDTIFDKMRLVKSYCGGKYGYFSAHAANSFTVVTFFSLVLRPYIKWFPILLLVWGLIVSYSRIYIGVHFPLDIITGISFGLLIGWLFYVLRNYAQKKIIK